MSDHGLVAADVSRWSARVLSGLILLVWGYFLIASLLGNADDAVRPLRWIDVAIVASLVVSLAGLAMAWRWEVVGALITLIAITFCAALNWRVLMFPGLLIPLTAILFVVAHWLGRAHRPDSEWGIENSSSTHTRGHSGFIS